MEEREPPLAAQAPSQPAFAHALVQTDAGSVARLCVVLQSNPPTMYVSHGGATWCAEKSAHKDHEQGQHVTKGNYGAQQPKTKYTFRPTTAAASPPNPSHLDLSIMHSVQHGRAYGQNRTTPQRLAVDLNVEDQIRSSTAHLHPEGKQRRSVNSSNGPQSATTPPPVPPLPHREEKHRQAKMEATQPRQHGYQAKKRDNGSRSIVAILVATEQQDVRLRAMDGVVLPSAALLDAQAAPFSLAEQAPLGHRL